MKVKIRGKGWTYGSVFVGASKSISNRVLLLKHLYDSDVQIGNLSTSEDTQYLKKALESSSDLLCAGEGGTTARFLMAYAASQEQRLVIDGSKRLRERPASTLLDALKVLGAEIEYINDYGYLPVAIKGNPDKMGGAVHVNNPESSQFLSALMMLGACKGLEITFTGDISWSYLNLTINMLNELYISCEIDELEDGTVWMKAGPGKPVFEDWYVVENDWSSACFWLGMVAQSPIHSEIELVGLQLGSQQPDAGIVPYFELLGVKISDSEEGIRVQKTGNPIVDSLFFDMSMMPDAFPILACTAAAMGLKSSFIGLHSLIHKESNRIETVANGLRLLGMKVEHNGVDSFDIIGGKLEKNGQEIETDFDHRIAMAFASIICVEGDVIIKNPSVVNKSYIDFWEHLSKHVGGVELEIIEG